MNSYQMVLHRPVETAGVFGNYEFPAGELADKPTFRQAGYTDKWITSGLSVIRPEPRKLESLVSALFGK